MMSKEFNSTNLSRAEFIERFQNEHQINNPMYDDKSTPNRWDYLHELGKIKQIKLQEKRKIQKEKEENNINSECTFSPKLTSYSTPSNNTSGLLIRQEIWNQKKSKHINSIKEFQKNKLNKECYFTPEINKTNALNKSHIKGTASNYLEDPESYELYITRLKKKREEDKKKLKRQNSLPGSGKIWKKNKKNFNLDYDYTKHEITERNLPTSKSITKYTVESSHTDINRYNGQSIINFPFYYQQMEYSKAVNLIHEQLFKISLLNE